MVLMWPSYIRSMRRALRVSATRRVFELWRWILFVKHDFCDVDGNVSGGGSTEHLSYFGPAHLFK